MRWTEEQLQEWLVGDALRRNQPSVGAPSTRSTKSARQKYGNRKVTDAEGRVHDSTKEFRRWQELQLREKAGEISQLRRQVKLELIPAQVVNGEVAERAVCWFADFVYEEGGAEIWEDSKGVRTREYILKRKLALYLRGVRIRET